MVRLLNCSALATEVALLPRSRLRKVQHAIMVVKKMCTAKGLISNLSCKSHVLKSAYNLSLPTANSLTAAIAGLLENANLVKLFTNARFCRCVIFFSTVNKTTIQFWPLFCLIKKTSNFSRYSHVLSIFNDLIIKLIKYWRYIPFYESLKSI